MKIKITNRDIKDGIRKNMRLCPIGLALRRQFPEATTIEVCGGYIDIDGKSYKPSQEIIDFIQRYDHYLNVKPFSFELSSLKSFGSWR